MHIALYQPDIPQNTGTIIRMAVCFGLPIDIIEPCGFVLLNDKGLKRAGMDYLPKALLTRYDSWDDFLISKPKGRIILCTTKGSIPYFNFHFEKDDILLIGRESCGVPTEVHEKVDARITIPMKKGERSLNVALSCAIICGEAMRQIDLFRHL